MADKHTIDEEKIEQVSGGSWRVPEFKAKAIGLELRNSDGTPGEFGYFWNDGDYYFKGEKLTDGDLMDLINFYDANGYAAMTLEQANNFCADRRKGKL